MAPKAKAAAHEEVVEEPKEPEPKPLTEDEVTELSTGLVLRLRGVDVAQIWALEGDYAAQAKVASDHLGLETAFPLASQRGIVCDFHLYNLIQAKALCLAARQAAVFHTIMSTVLDMMRFPGGLRDFARPQEASCGQVDCFKRFQEMLLQHCVSEPPERLGIFTLPQARALTDFAAATLFKHFLLYQFCLNTTQASQTVRCRRSVQRPLPVPDLSTAQLKPRRQDTAPSAAGGEGNLEEEPKEETPEDEEAEMQRLLEEKLRETEAALQAKLDAREEAFRQRLAAKAEPKADPKAKTRSR